MRINIENDNCCTFICLCDKLCVYNFLWNFLWLFVCRLCTLCG